MGRVCGLTSKPRQMPIKSINSRKFNYLFEYPQSTGNDLRKV